MNGFRYVETKRIIPKKIVDQNQIKINYLYASLIYREYLNALVEITKFDNELNNNYDDKMMIDLYNNDKKRQLLSKNELNYVENKIVTYYVLYSRMVNLACEACESYSRAILLDNNEPFQNIVRQYAHNLFSMYDKLKMTYEDEFCNITKQEEQKLQTLSPSEVNEQINIRSRYPGEFISDDNYDVVFKLLEDIRNTSLLCNNPEDEIGLSGINYTKNNNLQITEELKEKYSDKINLINSELMTEELLSIVSTFGYDYIFSTKQKDEQNKVDIYTLRSRVIKKSCDVYEHSSIYLNLKEGKNWSDYLKTKHNFRKIFYLLTDEEQLSMLLETFFNFDNLDEQVSISNAFINSNPEDSILLMTELFDCRFIDNNGFLGLSIKQKSDIIEKNGNVKENISIEDINNTIEKIFDSDAIKRLNNLSRIPGNYYINYNAAMLYNEAFVISKYKRPEKIRIIIK